MSEKYDIFDEETAGLMGRFESWVVRKVLDSWEHSEVELELNQAELLDELKTISRVGIIKGALAGALSGLCSLLCFWLAAELFPMEHLSLESWSLALCHYGIELGGSIVATILEIGYLYYLAAESAQKMLALTQERSLIKDKDIAKTLGMAMVRAGFESPNSRDIRLNIDPLMRASRWKLFASGALYKTKILISNQAVKQIWKRVGPRLFGRSISRVAIEAICVPVFAFWDGLVCSMVFREMRIRAQSIDKVTESIGGLYPIDNLSPEQEARLLGMISLQVTTVCDFHPSVILAMDALRDMGHLSVEVELPATWNVETFFAGVLQLELLERQKLAHLLALLLCLDRRARRKGKRYLIELLGERKAAEVLLRQYWRYVEHAEEAPVHQLLA